MRNLRTGATSTVELGTNSLAQVDVTTGGINARYGNSQSGVVNYVTRTGGSQFGGTVSFLTDRLAPSAKAVVLDGEASDEVAKYAKKLGADETIAARAVVDDEGLAHVFGEAL